jgi:hypothetical protein
MAMVLLSHGSRSSLHATSNEPGYNERMASVNEVSTNKPNSTITPSDVQLLGIHKPTITKLPDKRKPNELVIQLLGGHFKKEDMHEGMHTSNIHTGGTSINLDP